MCKPQTHRRIESVGQIVGGIDSVDAIDVVILNAYACVWLNVHAIIIIGRTCFGICVDAGIVNTPRGETKFILPIVFGLRAGSIVYWDRCTMYNVGLYIGVLGALPYNVCIRITQKPIHTVAREWHVVICTYEIALLTDPICGYLCRCDRHLSDWPARCCLCLWHWCLCGWLMSLGAASSRGGNIVKNNRL